MMMTVFGGDSIVPLGIQNRKSNNRGMMGVQCDIECDIEGVQCDIEGVQCDIEGVQCDIEGVQCDIEGVQCDIEGVQCDIEGVQCDIEGVQCDIEGVQCDIEGVQCDIEGVQCDIEGVQCDIEGVQCVSSSESKSIDSQSREWCAVYVLDTEPLSDFCPGSQWSEEMVVLHNTLCSQQSQFF